MLLSYLIADPDVNFLEKFHIGHLHNIVPRKEYFSKELRVKWYETNKVIKYHHELVLIDPYHGMVFNKFLSHNR